MNEYKSTPKSKQIERDLHLEELLFNIQKDIGKLSSILQDYIYMNANSLEYPVIKKRSHDEFYKDFNIVVKDVGNELDNILKLMPHKNPNDYTLIMNLLDENTPYNFLWFHYHIILIKRIMDVYINRINNWESVSEQYGGLSFLDGDANFLYEMCFDISSFIYDFYLYKAYEYKAKYIENTNRIFTRYKYMPRMKKSHKAYSRTLLDSCEGVLRRSFFKNDINVVPIMTSILRLIIELRFEECFGIQAICKDESKNKVVKVIGSKYFELPSLDKYTVFPIPLETLKRIYGWASEFVHRGVSDYYWIIFFVKQYLLDFVLCEVYMEKSYYDNLKNKIATLFGVTVDSIIWRQSPIMLKPVTQEHLNNIKIKVKNTDFRKICQQEQEQEMMELELHIKKNIILEELLKNKPFIYKATNKYFVISNTIFEECTDKVIKNLYDKLHYAIMSLDGEFTVDSKIKQLKIDDLKIVICEFLEIRNYCDERAERNRKEWELNHNKNDNNSVEMDVNKRLYVWLSKNEKETIISLEHQIVDLKCLEQQSVGHDVINEEGSKL